MKKFIKIKTFIINLLVNLTIFLIIICNYQKIQAKQQEQKDQLSFKIQSPIQQHSKIKIQSLIIGKNTEKTIDDSAKIIKYDLEFTDQLEVDLKKINEPLNKKIEEKLVEKGISLLLYLTTIQVSSPKKLSLNKVKINLKDLLFNTIIFEKEFEINEKKIVFDSHKISDELLPILTGEKGIALNSLVYCKMIKPRHKTICIADYACKKEKTLIQSKTFNITPCWHTKAPILFYSQFTKINNRLMSINLLTKKHKIICSYDGLNMQPSFSNDGTKAVLCLSGGKNSELYLYDHKICKKIKKRAFIQLTKNGGNNVSPCFLENGDIIFCSDYQTGMPQIYYLNRKKRKTFRLTNGNGYCAAPSYCQKTNNIVYTRVVNSVFQLFTINLDDFYNLQEKQLTFIPGNKHEPSFSQCGRFIAFSYDFINKNGQKNSQIAVLNKNSGKIRILTTGKETKSFPKWGKQPLYI
ncbi:PD40 domain-containing protein [Candidatus Babeliales bacterium]|nr:PD40 domain-containing protein [Candidatus Babeliales bacterium]